MADGRSNPKSVSIVDVAKEAGVAPSTVSRALNGSSRVNPETQKKIIEIAGRLGFSLSPRRPGPKLGQTRRKKKMIALITFVDCHHYGADTPSTFFSLQRGVNKGANENGFAADMYILSSGEALPESITKGGYVGYLLRGGRPQPAAAEFLKQKPCCWVMSGPWNPTWGDHVMPDHREGGMIAARYLIEHGCKYPAIVKLGQLDRVQELRIEGFVYVATQNKVDARILTAKNPFSDESLAYPEVVYVDEIIEGIKQMEPRSDGFFMDWDLSLSSLHPIMVREKLIIPGKTVLIGSDNQPQYLKGIEPYPATMETHFELIGKLGAAQLAWRLKNGSVCGRMCSLISPSLIAL